MWENHPPRATVGCAFGKLDLYLGATKELHQLAGTARGWPDLPAVGLSATAPPLPAVSSHSWKLEMTRVDVSVTSTTRRS